MTKMIYAHELAVTAPDAQMRRCAIAYAAICDGRWQDAALALRNAAREEAGTAWGGAAQQLADFCGVRA